MEVEKKRQTNGEIADVSGVPHLIVSTRRGKGLSLERHELIWKVGSEKKEPKSK